MASQSEHSALPACDILPASQAVQALLPAAERMPAGQGSQVLEASECFPAGQSWHLVPLLPTTRPAGQSSQVKFTVATLPRALQSSYVVWSPEGIMSDGQLEQLLPELEAYLPRAHWAHCVDVPLMSGLRGTDRTAAAHTMTAPQRGAHSPHCRGSSCSRRCLR